MCSCQLAAIYILCSTEILDENFFPITPFVKSLFRKGLFVIIRFFYQRFLSE